MESIKDVMDLQVADDNLRSCYEGRLNPEAQFNTPNTRIAAGLDYSNSFPDKYSTEPTGDYVNRKGATDGKSGHTEGSQKVDTSQLRTSGQTSKCETPTTTDCLLSGQSKSSGTEYMTTIVQGVVDDLPPHTTGCGLPVCYEGSAESFVATMSGQHCGVRLQASGMDGELGSQGSTVGEIIGLGFDEPAGEGTAYQLDQDCGTHRAAQSSGIESEIKKTCENESQTKNISFKLPVSKIPDAEFFGFSFSPRFDETTGSGTQELRPTLNPFEDIERQGRYSPLNHPRSPPGSRHHSRSSTSGLQAFRLLPPAMKTSKETGDQPPIIHSSPLLSGTRRDNTVKDAEGLIVGTEENSSYGDELCLRSRTNTEGACFTNVESLDIKDFGILFSPKQKLGLLESSSAGMKKKSGSNSVDAISASNTELLAETAPCWVVEMQKNETDSSIEPSGKTFGPAGSKAH